MVRCECIQWLLHGSEYNGGNAPAKIAAHRNSPTTVGSKSTKTARGTCFPAPVSLKNVLNESSPPPMVLSEGISPSGWMPCSRQ